MKIIHTSDWHLGIKLHRIDLMDQATLFIHWLIEVVKEQKIDAVVHSGDVFDTKYPPQEAVDLYHYFLSAMIQHDVQVVVTAGNHDSGNFIESPHDLLKHLKLKVVGNPDPVHRKEITLLTDRTGEAACVVAAIPFIKEGSLAIYEAGMDRLVYLQAIKASMAAKYTAVAQMARHMHPGLPIIGTGHLFLQGSEISDAEHQIHVGNLGGLDALTLDQGYDYLALGHIHKPQSFGTRHHINYSGSPTPLSFSEINDVKRVNLLTIEDNQVTWQPLETPVFRKLIRMQGTLGDVVQQIATHEKSGTLPDIAEVTIIQEDGLMPSMEPILEAMKARPDKNSLLIARQLIRHTYQQSSGTIPNDVITYGHMKPADMLERLLTHKGVDSAEIESLMATFNTIISEEHETE